MRLRAMVPQSIRVLYRSLRWYEPPLRSKEVPEELIRDCKFCASRSHMLNHLPQQAVVAELGTFRGNFARDIMSRCNPRAFHLIDIDYSNFDESGLTDARVKRHEGLTDRVISTFPDHYFDWIYVDADHSYDGAMRDVQASAPKVKPGGFLVFNDFTHIDVNYWRYGVHRAVVDFAVDASWPFRYFAFDGAALYDVALQKPTEQKGV